MKKIKGYVISIFIFVICFLTFNNQVMAASYSVSLGYSSVTKGSSTTLYIKCSGVIGGFSVKSSNSNVASVASGTAWCEENTVSINISTTIAGNATITVTPLSVADSNGNDLSLSSKSVSVTVNNPVVVNKSSDATLSSLSVDGVGLSPEFNKDTLEYTVELEAETTKINVKAEANDSKAKVDGAGEKEVSDGSNKIEVVVTAEDGTTKTYVINANVKELNPITVKIDEKEYTVVRKRSDLPELELFEEATVKINDEDVVSYYNDVLDVYVVALKDSNGNVGFYAYDEKKNEYVEYKQITVGSTALFLKNGKLPNDNYQKYTEVVNDIDVSIYKLKASDKVGLIYGVNVVTGKEGYFVYNKEEESLQLYFDEEVEIYKEQANSYFIYLMISLGVLIFVIIMIIIKMMLKFRRKKKKIKRM